MNQKTLMFAGFGPHRTKVVILREILSDHNWHATKELSRRVGHTFAVATHLLRKHGYVIDVERHPDCRYHFRSRLLEQRGR